MNAKLLKRMVARAEVIKALSHPSRVLIAESLGDGELCVSELTQRVGADTSTVSKHLTIMKQAGLLQADKRGLNIYYRLACPCLGDFFRCVDSISETRRRAT